MADSYIAIDEPGTVDKKLDTFQLTVGANTVERERFIIAGEGATDVHLPVAHDAADAGNPLKIGGRASAAAPTDVSAGNDRVNAWFLLNGAQATVITAAGALIGGDATNGLDVDVTRSALPSGAATSANQSTEITHLATVAGAVAGTEMQVDVLTSALPSGAATAAKQDTQITAEQAIQTSVELIDDAIKADDAAFTPATTKVLMAGFEFDDTAPDSVDEGDAGAARMSARREIYTQIRDAAGNERGANVNASNELLVAVSSVPSHAVTNAGTFAVQESGSALTALQLIDDGVYTDDTSTHSTGVSKGYGMMAVATPTDGSVNANDIGMLAMTVDRKLHVAVMDALPAGTNAIGKLAANSGVDIGDVDILTIAAGSNVIGDVGLAPRTSGGLSIHKSLDLDESEEEVKASAGQVYGVWFTNTATSTRWLKFYNDTAANVIVGTTVPVITIGLPGNTSDDISGALFNGGLGIPFSSAICAAVTTGLADNDTGAPAANDVVVNIFFK